MPPFFITKKSAPSSASEAASGVITKKSGKPAHKGHMKSGKGHFAGAAQRLAKLRSGNLQHGIPKNAPLGALPIAGSTVPPNSTNVMAGNMNDEEQGE